MKRQLVIPFSFLSFLITGFRAFSDGHVPVDWREAVPLPESPFAFSDDVLTFTNEKFYAKSPEFIYESSDGENWIPLSRTWLTTDRERVLVVNTVLPYPGGVAFAYDNVSDGTQGLLLSTLATLDGHQGIIEDVLGDIPVVFLDEFEVADFGSGFSLYRPPGVNEVQWQVDENGRVVTLAQAGPEAPAGLRVYDGEAWQAIAFPEDLSGARLTQYGGAVWLTTPAGVWQSGDHGKTWDPVSLNFSLFGGSTADFVPGDDAGEIYEAGQGAMSTDGGQQWVQADAPPRVAENHHTYFANGVWVTIGFGGTIASSVDGLKWRSHALPDPGADLIDAAYGNERWVVIGVDSVVVADVKSVDSVGPSVPPLELSVDLVLSFPTMPGFTYTIQRGDLIDWEDIETVNGDGTEARIPQAKSESAAFLRVLVKS